jgi:hypothetical protein
MTGAWRRGASGQDRGDASWLPYMAGRHPWAAAALGLGGIPAAIAYGPRLLGAGAGLLGAGADAGAAAVGLGGSIGGGVFAGLGAIAGFSAYGIGSEYMRRRQAGQGVWGAGMGMAANAVTGPFGPLGAVLAPATWGAQALGRRFAGVPSERDEARTSASHAAAMRDRGYLDPEEQWRRIRAGETIGRPAGSIRSEQERAAARTAARTAQTDPVLQFLSKREQDLRDLMKEIPNWFREAERQRQQQQPELKVSGEIGFAPEMTVKMLYQLNGQMWREFQAGVS